MHVKILLATNAKFSNGHVIINNGLMLDNKVLITLSSIYIYIICVKNFYLSVDVFLICARTEDDINVDKTI